MTIERAANLKYLALAPLVAVAVLLASPGRAQEPAEQDSAAADEPAGEIEEIIVTGTLIRGVDPTGAKVTSVSMEDIIVSGATTTNEVLATIPLVSSNFNNVRSLPAGGSGISNLAPSLRNFGPSAAPTTLLLMDGHRMINAGLLQTSPDPDVLPPGVLASVEIVPDGGSAIYGSDAVGGVINMRTRDSFDGVEISARLGFADAYSSTDVNLTAGRDWGSGSAFLSYAYLGNDEIYGRDRDFMQQITDNGGQCGAGTVFVGGQSFALPDRVPGTITDCDITDDQSFYPDVTRHSVFAGFTQELTETITFDFKAFYTDRESVNQSDPDNNGSGGAGQTAVICSPILGQEACSAIGGVVFAGYVPVPGDVGVQTVAFNYAGLIDTAQPNELDVYQLTPSLTFDLGNSWQLTALASYGESTIDSFSQLINGTRQIMAIATGVLNPYDPRSGNPDAISSVFSNFIGSGSQELVNARLVADGDLMDISGGTIGLAVGVEYTEEKIKDVIFGEFAAGTGTEGANPISADRDIKSIFAEFAIPLVGEGNAMTGIQSFDLSLSGRYDDYSDFGSTFNPKFGFTYEPVQWMSFRGNWGESFVAPSLADTNAPDTRSFSLPAFLALAPGVPPTSLSQQLVVLVGGNPDLGPQEADTWELGVDIDVTSVPGLTLSATYYDIHYQDQIAINTTFYTPASEPFWVLSPTQAQVEAAIAKAPPYLGVPVSLLYTPAFGGGVYSLLDFRRNNLAQVKQSGFDFDIRHVADTNVGTIHAGIGGTYTLNRDVMSGVGADFVDVLQSPGASELALSANVGWQSGKWTANATWYHTGGYDLDPVVTTNRFGTQSDVGSFDTVDLFFRYDLDILESLDELSLTLNVENVFDEDPPFYSGPSAIGGLSGYANGSTLGRLITLGVRTKF